jgi:hypothetical protein
MNCSKQENDAEWWYHECQEDEYHGEVQLLVKLLPGLKVGSEQESSMQFAWNGSKIDNPGQSDQSPWGDKLQGRSVLGDTRGKKDMVVGDHHSVALIAVEFIVECKQFSIKRWDRSS